MSTRCQIHFMDDETTVAAKVYRHSDGYPDGPHGMFAELDSFFKDVETECSRDTRFDDPEYLAAKFVVWQMEKSLDSIGCGVILHDHGDIEHIYEVIANYGDGRPTVKHRKPTR